MCGVRALWVILLLAMTPGIAQASTLRVYCDRDAVGAEVSVNGQFKGECPIDIEVPEGTSVLKATKSIDGVSQTFEQSVRLGDGVAKDVEISFGATVSNRESDREYRRARRASQDAPDTSVSAYIQQKAAEAQAVLDKADRDTARAFAETNRRLAAQEEARRRQQAGAGKGAADERAAAPRAPQRTAPAAQAEVPFSLYQPEPVVIPSLAPIVPAGPVPRDAGASVGARSTLSAGGDLAAPCPINAKDACWPHVPCKSGETLVGGKCVSAAVISCLTPSVLRDGKCVAPKSNTVAASGGSPGSGTNPSPNPSPNSSGGGGTPTTPGGSGDGSGTVTGGTVTGTGQIANACILVNDVPEGKGSGGPPHKSMTNSCGEAIGVVYCHGTSARPGTKESACGYKDRYYQQIATIKAHETKDSFFTMPGDATLFYGACFGGQGKIKQTKDGNFVCK